MAIKEAPVISPHAEQDGSLQPEHLGPSSATSDPGNYLWRSFWLAGVSEEKSPSLSVPAPAPRLLQLTGKQEGEKQARSLSAGPCPAPRARLAGLRAVPQHFCCLVSPPGAAPRSATPPAPGWSRWWGPCPSFPTFPFVGEQLESAGSLLRASGSCQDRGPLGTRSATVPGELTRSSAGKFLSLAPAAARLAASGEAHGPVGHEDPRKHEGAAGIAGGSRPCPAGRAAGPRAGGRGCRKWCCGRSCGRAVTHRAASAGGAGGAARRPFPTRPSQQGGGRQSARTQRAPARAQEMETQRLYGAERWLSARMVCRMCCMGQYPPGAPQLGAAGSASPLEPA